MKPVTNTELYWRLRELAVTARCTLRALLQEAGVSSASVHDWTTGTKKPRPTTLARIYGAHVRIKKRNDVQ